MESKKWLALALLLIAVIASLEYMPRNILLRVAIPSDASYPLNKGPYGTSILWSRLSMEGYREAIVYGYSGLPKLSHVRDVVFLEVGGTSAQPPIEAYKLMESLVEKGVRVHLVVLDEEPSRGVSRLIENASDLICGTLPPMIKGPLNNTFSDLYLVVGSRVYDLPTGYTGYISYDSTPIATPGRPHLPQGMGAYRYIAASWPFTEAPYNGFWYITGIECSSSRGSILLIADSTIATNMMARAHPEALQALAGLLGKRVSSPETTLILVDEEFYVNPGQGNLQLILSLHPSVFLLAFARAYSGVESLVIRELSSHRLTPLLLLGIATIVSSATIHASRMVEKEGVKGEKRPKKIRRPKVSLDIGIGFWREAARACERAEDLTTLAVGRKESREAIARLTSEVGVLCKRVKGSRVLRYIPLWGSLKRSVVVKTALALSLAGVYPYREALELLEGEGSEQ